MRYLHRLILIPLMLVVFGWELLALRVNPFDLQFLELLKALYIAIFTVVFWPVAYILLVDYFHSRLGWNGKHYLDYARALQKDLVVAGLTALALASIYWLDTVSYGFSGIDIAFVGFPFLINALYTLIQGARVTIAGQPVLKWPALLAFGVVLAFTSTAFWLLVKNASGELETDQALFLQLTILFSGLCFFMSSNLMLHSWKRGRIEASAFLLYFFSEVVSSKYHIYSGQAAQLELLNRNLAQRKSQHAAALRRRQKEHTRKRR